MILVYKGRDSADNILIHCGVKGMKWGVKNGPPYPIKRNGKSMIVKSKVRNEIDKAVKSGLINLTMNREKQLRHTIDGRYGGRSYLNGDLSFAENLIKKLSGTGEVLIDKNGNWNHREFVKNKGIIGFFVDNKTGEETPSNRAVIIYSKTGTHIYPLRRK